MTAQDTEYAAAARRLADRLAALAEPGPDGAPVWSGDDIDPVRSSEQHVVLTHGRLDDGLLTGRTGIAAALATAARLPGGRPAWLATARYGVWSAVRAGLQGPLPPPGGLGWSSGWLGIARGAGLIAGWTGDRALTEAGRALAGRAVEALLLDPGRCPDYPDLLDGLAGHLVAVLAADVDPVLEPARRTAARSLLSRLLTHAGVDPADPAGPLSWPMAGQGPAVVGLAHGGSGITIALAAAAATGLTAGGEVGPEDRNEMVGPEDRNEMVDLDTMIGRSRQWEDGHFRVEVGGWPDLRASADVPGLAWCHGAPGVGIAAAYRAMVSSDQAEGAEETYLRARSIVQAYGRPPGTAPFDGTLCHGLGGLVELHLVGAEAWPVAAREHLSDARLLARDLTRAGRADRPGWVCGVRDGRTPNLLTGLAGVTYTLARCHDPALGPSLAHPGLPARAPLATAGA